MATVAPCPVHTHTHARTHMPTVMASHNQQSCEGNKTMWTYLEPALQVASGWWCTVAIVLWIIAYSYIKLFSHFEHINNSAWPGDQRWCNRGGDFYLKAPESIDNRIGGDERKWFNNSVLELIWLLIVMAFFTQFGDTNLNWRKTIKYPSGRNFRISIMCGRLMLVTVLNRRYFFMFTPVMGEVKFTNTS